jgi:hypothetical protein
MYITEFRIPMALTDASTIQEQDLPAVLPLELAYALFDQESRRIIGVPGEEFLARWDAGEFRNFDDTPEDRELAYLVLLTPFGRRMA